MKKVYFEIGFFKEYVIELKILNKMNFINGNLYYWSICCECFFLYSFYKCWCIYFVLFVLFSVCLYIYCIYCSYIGFLLVL